MKLKLTPFLFILLLFSDNLWAYEGKFESNTSYQVCFVPPQKCDEQISSILDQSKESIYVQAYHLTNKSIISAIMRAHDRGIRVGVILDKAARKEGWVLQENGIEINIDYRRSIAHNKVMIIDGVGVITGSFNFTESAQKKNVENFIYIKDQQLATDYYENYKSRLQQSKKAETLSYE